MNNIQIKITVAICTFNRAEILSRCLETLNKQNLPQDQYEILVINNNSTDDTPLVLTRFQNQIDNLRFVTETTQGLSHARNRAINEARGHFIVFLDDESLAPEFLLKKIVYCFDTVAPTPISVGFKVIPHYITQPPFWFDDDFEIRQHGDISRFLTPEEEKSGFCGSCMAFKTSFLNELGGFDSELGMKGNKIGSGEESDLYLRIATSENYSHSTLFWYDSSNFIENIVQPHELTLRYRLKRGYYFGCSTRSHSQNKRPFYKILAGFSIPVLDFVIGLGQLLIEQNNPKKLSTRFVILLINVSWKVGYYYHFH